MITDKDIERRIVNRNEYVEYYKSLMRFSFLPPSFNLFKICDALNKNN